MVTALPPPPQPLLSSPALPPLTFLGDHPPASYPTGGMRGQLCVRSREADGADVVGKVHGPIQLQQGDVTPHVVALVKVSVDDDSVH